jgi:molybdenum cofactor cytidylyltransferase
MGRVAQALLDGASLAAPVYRGRRGHPVGFGCEWGERLAGLEGDVGARAILSRNADRLTLIECDDPGVLADVDRREDLLAMGASTRGDDQKRTQV